MDELDNLAVDPLGSLAPGAAQVAKALGLLSDLLGTAPVRTQRWEPRDRGNGLSYRLWDALPLVHTLAAADQVTEPTPFMPSKPQCARSRPTRTPSSF